MVVTNHLLNGMILQAVPHGFFQPSVCMRLLPCCWWRFLEIPGPRFWYHQQGISVSRPQKVGKPTSDVFFAPKSWGSLGQKYEERFCGVFFFFNFCFPDLYMTFMYMYTYNHVYILYIYIIYLERERERYIYI